MEKEAWRKREDGCSEDESAIRIAKLYYELHYNQLEIAAREGISKSSVSRILKNAMDMGIIEVRIKDSVLANGNLENELIARFPIKRRLLCQIW